MSIRTDIEKCTYTWHELVRIEQKIFERRTKNVIEYLRHLQDVENLRVCWAYMNTAQLILELLPAEMLDGKSPPQIRNHLQGMMSAKNSLGFFYEKKQK